VSLLVAVECAPLPPRELLAHDNNGDMVAVVMVVAVVPSIVLANGKCRQRRAQQCHTEQ